MIYQSYGFQIYDSPSPQLISRRYEDNPSTCSLMRLSEKENSQTKAEEKLIPAIWGTLEHVPYSTLLFNNILGKISRNAKPLASFMKSYSVISSPPKNHLSHNVHLLQTFIIRLFGLPSLSCNGLKYLTRRSWVNIFLSIPMNSNPSFASKNS